MPSPAARPRRAPCAQEEAVRLAFPAPASSASSPPPAATTTTSTDHRRHRGRRRATPRSGAGLPRRRRGRREHLRLLDGRAHLRRRRREAPRLLGHRRHRRRSRHGRRLRPLLHRRDRHLRRLPSDQGRGGRRPAPTTASSSSSSRSPSTASRCSPTRPTTAVECVSFADLYALIGPESDGVDNWSDAQALATELGSTTELPDAELDDHRPGRRVGHLRQLHRDRVRRHRRGPGSRPARSPRTRSRPAATTTRRRPTTPPSSPPWRPRTTRSAGSASPSPRRPVTRSRSSRCPPSPAASASSPRPRPSPTPATRISRGLYIYVNAANAEENPAVAGYVDYYLSDEGIASVSEVGYVDLPADQLEATRAVWDARDDRHPGGLTPATPAPGPALRIGAGPGPCTAPTRSKDAPCPTSRSSRAAAALRPPRRRVAGRPRRIVKVVLTAAAAHVDRHQRARSSGPSPGRPSRSSPRSSGRRSCRPTGGSPGQGVYDIRHADRRQPHG